MHPPCCCLVLIIPSLNPSRAWLCPADMQNSTRPAMQRTCTCLGTSGDTRIYRGGKKNKIKRRFPSSPPPTAYGTVLKKSFDLLITFQVYRQSNSMDLFHQKLKVSCTAQISKRSTEMGWGGNIFTDTRETLFKTPWGDMEWNGLWYSLGGNSETLNSCAQN